MVQSGCLPASSGTSSIPSFPRGESLLMKELLSLSRGRGAIKMKTNGEVGADWEVRGEDESSVGVFIMGW